MTTSEKTYSLLSHLPIRIAHSSPPMYYWHGISLVEPMVLAIISSVIFKIPTSPEIRQIAGRSQRLAVLNRTVMDFIPIDDTSEQDPDQNYYYIYFSVIKSRMRYSNSFDQYSIEEILDWIHPQETV